MILLFACARPSSLDGLKVVFGDLHVHTGASGDGCSSDLGRVREKCGALAEIGNTDLDFFAVTDHVNGPQVLEGGQDAWRAALDAEVGGPLLVPGAEISVTTGGQELGHKTALFFGDASALARDDASPTGGTGTEIASCEALFQWAAALSDRVGPLALVPHHPAAAEPMATDHACHDPTWEPAIETYGHFGDSRIVLPDAPDYDPIPFRDPEGTVQYALTAFPDRRLGFVGGTDVHTTEPGAVCATPSGPYGGGLTGAALRGELSLDSLHDALATRATWSTSGPRVPAWMTVWDGDTLLGHVGEEITTSATTVRVEVEVASEWAEDVTEVAIVQAGDAPGGETRTALDGWTGEIPVSPGGFAYAMITLEGERAHPPGCDDGPNDDEREQVWLSPVWFR